MKKPTFFFAATLLLSQSALAGQSFTKVIEEINSCNNPCGSSEPCGCCATEAEKKACLGGDTKGYTLTIDEDGGYRAVKK